MKTHQMPAISEFRNRHQKNRKSTKRQECESNQFGDRANEKNDDELFEEIEHSTRTEIADLPIFIVDRIEPISTQTESADIPIDIKMKTHFV